MKKLIAIAVVFALAAGMVFADVGGQIIGSVRLFESDTGDDSIVQSYGLFSRWRLEGSGQSGDGDFGAWLRFGMNWYEDNFHYNGMAWWKPIDQLKLTIGGNPDGIFGKEGYSAWMFHQIVADTAVVNASQAWGCDYTIGDDVFSDNGIYSGAIFRDAFYGGFGGNGLLLEIKPADIFGLNIVLPIWGRGWNDGVDDRKTSTFFKNMTIQADVNLDVGNLAFTFDLESWTDETVTDFEPNNKVGGKIYAYFGLTSVDNLSLDLGIGFGLPQTTGDDVKITRMNPLGIGLGAKYTVNEAFGLKARLLAEFMGSTKTDVSGDKPLNDPFQLIFDILPFYAISDSVTLFVDIGINMIGATSYDGNEVIASGMGWHFNPYIQVGNEWGPSFFAGIKVYSSPSWVEATSGTVPYVLGDSVINWSVPIALCVSF